MSIIEERVCNKILKRSEVGKEKYGTTMERSDLSRLEWLIHAQEEAMDLAVYLQKLIDEEKEKKPCEKCRCKSGLQEWTRTSSLEEFEAEEN
jgi:hypothetical protein